MAGQGQITGAPHVFVKENAKKLYHGQVVQLVLFGVLCQNGCGLFYIPPSKADEAKPMTGRGTECPTCSHFPRPEKVSTEPDLVEYVVKMAFGNVNFDFVRAVGPAKITRVPLVFSQTTPAESRALITPEGK